MNGFAVLTTALFDRLMIRLSRHHSDLPQVLNGVIAILQADPYNITRRHLIRKLKGVKPGEGQYRIRAGRWRFRYDVWDKRHEVELSYCGLRREDSY